MKNYPACKRSSPSVLFAGYFFSGGLIHAYQTIKFLTAGEFEKQLPQEENQKSGKVMQ